MLNTQQYVEEYVSKKETRSVLPLHTELLYVLKTDVYSKAKLFFLSKNF